MIPTLFWSTDEIRRLASAELDPVRRSELGQFMTPSPIANFMVSLFDRLPDDVRLLDPGAGIGSLTEAFAKRYYTESGHSRLSVSVFEIEEILTRYLSHNLDHLSVEGREAHIDVTATLRESDFVLDVAKLVERSENPFTHVILNPPYKKLASNSEYKRILMGIGIDVPNLYAAFLALSIELVREGGEVVAIIPRSFCNGAYFLTFRNWLLDRVAIKHIHVFESRSKAFGEDGVLQENVIFHFVRGAAQDQVRVTSSRDATFDNLSTRLVDFAEIVSPDDSNHFIRIPTTVNSAPIFFSNLSDLGLEVATGPVVDFRVRDYWLHKPEHSSVPLLYAHHFSDKGVVWPREHKKPNALRIASVTEKLLMPKGWYVVVRRFSAKEERRRVVAHLVDPSRLPYEHYGFENHLNVIHARRAGLDSNMARGLMIYLNSSLVDSYFRTFSGHTQVNATDLRSMFFPSRKTLDSLGRAVRTGEVPDQIEIDKIVTSYAETK